MLSDADFIGDHGWRQRDADLLRAVQDRAPTQSGSSSHGHDRRSTTSTASSSTPRTWGDVRSQHSRAARPGCDARTAEVEIETRVPPPTAACASLTGSTGNDATRDDARRRQHRASSTSATRSTATSTSQIDGGASFVTAGRRRRPGRDRGRRLRRARPTAPCRLMLNGGAGADQLIGGRRDGRLSPAAASDDVFARHLSAARPTTSSTADRASTSPTPDTDRPLQRRSSRSRNVDPIGHLRLAPAVLKAEAGQDRHG